MSHYDGRPSSREKDLVDLVVFAVTQNIEGKALSLALKAERNRRGMDHIEKFVVPTSWGHGYSKLCKPVPYCSQYPTVELASELVSRLIDPALSGEVRGKTWSATRLIWE